jgi:hypothetical protein
MAFRHSPDHLPCANSITCTCRFLLLTSTCLLSLFGLVGLAIRGGTLFVQFLFFWIFSAFIAPLPILKFLFSISCHLYYLFCRLSDLKKYTQSFLSTFLTFSYSVHVTCLFPLHHISLPVCLHSPSVPSSLLVHPIPAANGLRGLGLKRRVLLCTVTP